MTSVVVHCLLAAVTLLFLLMLSPILIIHALVVFLWRIIVRLLGNCKKDFVEMASGNTAIFLSDHFLKNPHCSVPSYAILEGPVDFDTFKAKFDDFIHQRKEDGKTYKYERMLQYPKLWGGYTFWVWDKQFDIANHVQLIDDVEVTEDNMRAVFREMIRQPHKPNTPVWEMRIFPKYNGNTNQFVVLLRIHHSMADGLSIVKLLLSTNTASGKNFTKAIARSKRTRRSVPQKIVTFFQFSFGAAYIYLRELVLMADTNPIMNNKKPPTGKWHFSKNLTVDMADLKAAQVALNAPLTALFLVAFCDAFEKFVEEKYGKDKIPKSFHTVSSFPVNGHPDESLVNHWTIILMTLILKQKTLGDKLTALKTEFGRAASSAFPIVSFFMFQVAGSLPIACIEPATKFKSSTVVMANIPGPATQTNFLDYPVLDIMYYLPIMRLANGIMFAMMSYNGVMHCNITGDEGQIGGQEDVDHFIDLVQIQLDGILVEASLLKQLGSNSHALIGGEANDGFSNAKADESV